MAEALAYPSGSGPDRLHQRIQEEIGEAVRAGWVNYQVDVARRHVQATHRQSSAADQIPIEALSVDRSEQGLQGGNPGHCLLAGVLEQELFDVAGEVLVSSLEMKYLPWDQG